MGNKSDETQILNKVLESFKFSKSTEKIIYNMISGIDAERELDERPDFVKISEYNGEKIVLGIEHFRVDHLSKSNSKSPEIIQSKNIKNEKEMFDFLNKIKQIKDSEILSSSENINTYFDLISKNVSNIIETSYNDFVASFDYSVNKHLNNVKVYRNTVNKIANGKNASVKLAFLIEIHIEFPKLFINDNGKFTNCTINSFPMFDDIVKKIEKLHNIDVDYVILCFGGAIYNGKEKIIGIKTQNIRNQLKRRKINIYKYWGEDFQLDKFKHIENDVQINSSINLDLSNKKILNQLTYKSNEISHKERLINIQNAWYFSLKSRKAKENFITTYPVQYLLEVYSKYIANWQNCNGNFVPDIKFNNFSSYEIKINSEVFNKKIQNSINEQIAQL